MHALGLRFMLPEAITPNHIRLFGGATNSATLVNEKDQVDIKQNSEYKSMKSDLAGLAAPKSRAALSMIESQNAREASQLQNSLLKSQLRAARDAARLERDAERESSVNNKPTDESNTNGHGNGMSEAKEAPAHMQRVDEEADGAAATGEGRSNKPLKNSALHKRKLKPMDNPSKEATNNPATVTATAPSATSTTANSATASTAATAATAATSATATPPSGASAEPRPS
jgi:hypothetical protein